MTAGVSSRSARLVAATASAGRGRDLPMSAERLRILAMYREMPGLRLTVDQLCRLSGLDREPCATALRSLVDDGLLGEYGQYYTVRNDS